MNIVITGGTGFIGQAVADLYIKAGHRVFVTGHEAPVPGADYLDRDFQAVDFSKLPTIDILNHQAAVTDPQHPDPDEVWKVNFRQALDFFQRAAGHGVKRIVYASSAAVYGDTRPPFKEAGPFHPLTAYGLAKLALDQLAADTRTDADGRVTLPNLIPGVTYRISPLASNDPVLRAFTVRPGETLNLKDIVFRKVN